MESCVEQILEADDDLSMPVIFKVFEPCTRDMHEECKHKTSTHECICQCHNKEYQNAETGEDKEW